MQELFVLATIVLPMEVRLLNLVWIGVFALWLLIKGRRLARWFAVVLLVAWAYLFYGIMTGVPAAL